MMKMEKEVCDFWDKRYRKGGKSGKGSTGKWRKWKWAQIEKYLDIKETTILDIGCGDLSFMKDQRPMAYTGVDISQHIIKKNRKEKSEWNFIIADVTSESYHKQIPRNDVVLAMDILFHIMDDVRFCSLLNNLNHLTGEYLFISSWSKNPFPYTHDHYQYFRDLKLWLNHLPNLALIAEHPNKFDEFNTLYVFKRKGNE